MQFLEISAYQLSVAMKELQHPTFEYVFKFKNFSCSLMAEMQPIVLEKCIFVSWKQSIKNALFSILWYKSSPRVTDLHIKIPDCSFEGKRI